ncbi:Transposase MuDR plant [Arabidopsis thaliana x Arabidopsis arenosa]|uniref:Transposase MuDR plant n=1 Tax=Arabidopsis thaliana x Arabidopsis arenosa TaxID=1240361 RepID=A0A8T2CFJ7_9BRAS|nr:Transposase MuDR plant [Arabidopsis thaliana x Arabidopsis arenosa]
MEQIILVCGKWIYDKRWLLIVNNKRGSWMLAAGDRTRYEDFIEMVYEDYGLDQRFSDVQLSYMFPKKILQKLPLDTPPVCVGNCRQLQSFLGQAKVDTVRLCVEVKDKVSSHSKQELEDDFVDRKRREKRPIAEDSVENEDLKKEDEDLKKEDEDDDRFDYCDDPDGTDSGDENLATYGMALEEESEEEKPNVEVTRASPIFVSEGTQNIEYAKLEMSCVDLAVSQCYDTKEHLETRLKILIVVQKFDFNVYKSTPFLLTVKCWVKGCSWKVRATPIGDYPKFHVRKYVADHSCSVTDRSARSRQATHEILGVLYKDFVGGVGPTVLPMHVADALTFSARINGFPYMRKAVVVDGTFLQGKYKGTLLTATAQDGNFQIFPVAFAVANKENDES